MAPRPRAPPIVNAYIPPERQSTRIKSQAVVQPVSQPAPSNSVATRNAARQPPAQEIDDDDDDERDEHSSDDYDGVFRSRPKLPQNVTRKRTLGELMQLLEDDILDLDPEYQRDVVWTAKGMSHLINSILEDYYIPPIILKKEIVSVQTDGVQSKLVCVDGKQRLSSVQAFLHGDIPCVDRKGRKWYYCDTQHDGPIRSRARRLVLSDADKDDFLKKTFVCTEYLNLTPDQEEDLFSRVQKGEQLKPAEKIRANTGPWQNLARLFERDFHQTISVGNTQRATGFRNILMAFANIVESKYPTNPNGKPAARLRIAELQVFCANEKACDEGIKSHLGRVFNTFQRLVLRSPETFGNNNYTTAKNFAPLEFPAVAVLISTYIDTRNSNMLLGDIREMRQYLREQLQDLRIDGKSWKVVLEYIENLESFRGATDGTTLRMIDPINTNVSGYQTASTRSTPQTTSSTVAASARSSKSSYPESPHGPAARERSESVDSVLGDSIARSKNAGPRVQQQAAAPLAHMGPTSPLSPVLKTEPVDESAPDPRADFKKRRSSFKLVSIGLTAADLEAKRRRLGNAS